MTSHGKNLCFIPPVNYRINPFRWPSNDQDKYAGQKDQKHTTTPIKRKVELHGLLTHQPIKGPKFFDSGLMLGQESSLGAAELWSPQISKVERGRAGGRGRKVSPATCLARVPAAPAGASYPLKTVII